MRAVLDSTTALILCGGRATRMGGVDKPLQAFQGRPLARHVLDRIAPQTGGRVLISANRHLDEYRRFGVPVLTDTLPDFPGPLAGMLAGMTALAEPLTPDGLGSTGAGSTADALGGSGRPTDAVPQWHPGTVAGTDGWTSHPGGDAWLLCVSGDSPWLPTDLAERLAAALPPGRSAAMALGRESPGEPLRSQPLASLIHLGHRQTLAAALRQGERRVEAWLRTLPLALVPFDRPEDDHAFANINDRSELERLQSRV
ncbi:hypothetical protein CDN99_09945 [Roseateles aquatilis]|uniref:Molybdenum cofactor guanylyltransferase n=1 Tax=Roseateles aquatilis TaxID=431061 RepID=A0A246JFS3_9BURK|nr:molybdenum cofactor guanylyltransferase [Roseateles aquatilis]OWQ91465.1 hypothetical protein CDN99_09945 [Roseateles aquatilis]